KSHAMSTSTFQLPFERPIFDLEARIAKIEAAAGDNTEAREEARKLKRELVELTKKIYGQLEPWEVVQVARHRDRPMTSDYLELCFEEFVELHGDKTFGDDRAIRTGFAKLDQHKVLFIGHQKGKTLNERKE